MEELSSLCVVVVVLLTVSGDGDLLEIDETLCTFDFGDGCRSGECVILLVCVTSGKVIEGGTML